MNYPSDEEIDSATPYALSNYVNATLLKHHAWVDGLESVCMTNPCSWLGIQDVLKFMLDAGYLIMVDGVSKGERKWDHDDGPWSVTFYNSFESMSDEQWHGWGDDFPVAVCRAALKARRPP